MQRDPVLLVAERDIDAHSGGVILLFIFVCSELLLDVAVSAGFLGLLHRVRLLGLGLILLKAQVSGLLVEHSFILLIEGTLLISLGHAHLSEGGHMFTSTLVAQNLRVECVLVRFVHVLDRVLLTIKLHAPVLLSLSVEFLPDVSLALFGLLSHAFALLNFGRINLGLECKFGVLLFCLFLHQSELLFAHLVLLPLFDNCFPSLAAIRLGILGRLIDLGGERVHGLLQALLFRSLHHDVVLPVLGHAQVL